MGKLTFVLGIAFLLLFGTAASGAEEEESPGLLSRLTEASEGGVADAVTGELRNVVDDNLAYVKDKVDSIEAKLTTIVFSFTTAQILISLGNMLLTAFLTSYFVSRRINTKSIEDAVNRVVDRARS